MGARLLILDLGKSCAYNFTLKFIQMKYSFNRTVFCGILMAATLQMSYASSDAEWVRVKSLVLPRPQPNNQAYTITTDSFLNKTSIAAVGRYKRAAFRQSSKDSTGYEMVFGRDRIIYYFYDCKAGQLVGTGHATVLAIVTSSYRMRSMSNTKPNCHSPTRTLSALFVDRNSNVRRPWTSWVG